MKSIKNFSRSLARFRSCHAFVALSTANTGCPVSPYLSPKCAQAIANWGSISTARRKKGIAEAPKADRFTFCPVLYALRASSEEVVNSASGVE